MTAVSEPERIRRTPKAGPTRWRPTVAILGAGAGGIAMGAALTRAGYDYTIYEKSDGVGGTWRDNTYPGAACDVPSHFYSFSFAPNPWWSRTYATQPEILSYLERCADQFGVRSHVQTGTAIREARWCEHDQQWSLTSDSGVTVHADVLVSGLGMLNIPWIPDLPGADRFRGRVFHSSRWDHSKPLTGERVASIGTGASAVQYVPAIAPETAHLTVFQRTPIWISPRIEGPYSAAQHRRFARVPFALRWQRAKIWWTYERADFETGSEGIRLQTALAQSYLERKIEDPELRAALTPDYPVGCKRPLMSREWYPTLVRSDVRLVTEPISEITEGGIRTADGEEHLVDTIIFGTGFRANEYLRSVEIHGREGQRLHDRWRDGAEAYLGVTVPCFPNLFLLYGPNTNGTTSVMFIHEAQVHYIMGALRSITRRRGGSLEVRQSVSARYNRRVQAALVGTVWTAGCTNYFRAPSGKLVTQLPMKGSRYWMRTRVFDRWRYRYRRSPATAGPGSGAHSDR